MFKASSDDPTVKVSVKLPGQGLFLIVADRTPLPEIIRRYHGRLITALGPERALALLELTHYLALRSSGAVRFIGPVNVDQKRFQSVLSGLSAAPAAPAARTA